MNSYVDFVVRFSSLSYEQILENQEIAAKNQKNMGFKLSDEVKSQLIKKLNKKRIKHMMKLNLALSYLIENLKMKLN